MKYDTEYIQKCYDGGLTWDEVCKKLKIGRRTLNKLRKQGLLKTRDLKSQRELSRADISVSMKRAHEEGRHPGWLSVNLNKEMRTYPEQFFIDIINNTEELNDYTILEKVAFYQYVFDFVIVEEKIDIEIDGEHHLNDIKTVEKDKRRDQKAIENGWRVFRISWHELQSDSSKVINALLNFIKVNQCEEKSSIQVITLEAASNKGFRAAKFKIGSPRKVRNKRQLGEYVPKHSLRKVERPSKEELEKLVWEIPTTKLAEKFGVSDRAIGKWCKWYGIIKPPRGYWMKVSKKRLKREVDKG